ncbi:MAG: PKD domain-containing protein [Chlorobi bacterium]|nr:PKD domain-containing protein [Chlorobiota bacterium]
MKRLSPLNFFLPLFLLFVLTSELQAQYDTLKVMYYNVLDFPNIYPERKANFRTVNQYVKADIILVNELKTTAGAIALLNEALNVYGTTHYQKAVYTEQDFSENLLYYNSDKLALYSQDVISTNIRDIDEYVLYYKSADLATTNDTVFFYFYEAHLKASQGYENTRLAEVNTFLNHLNAIPNAENVFFGGDFNLYTSSEPAYQAIMDNVTYGFNDPLPSGNWHNGSSYSDIHTQSTRLNDPMGGSTGGLDDRFDFILFTDDVANASNRVQYIPNSCIAFGNDGNHYNAALIDPPVNPYLPDSIIQALYYMSDHLPVICDLRVEATIDTTKANIVITEIMYNPPEVGTDSLEFIELFNNGNETENLAGFYFSAGIEFTFPSYVLNPGEFMVVGVNASALQNTFGVNALQWTSGGLSNGGELILLKDISGKTVDSVRYYDATPWPTTPDGGGPSLMLCDPGSDNSLGANWAASQNFVTNNGDGNPIYASPGTTECAFPPIAAFTANQTGVFEGESVQFTDLSTGIPDTYLWTFSGGSPATSSVQNPLVVYNLAGTYTVSLTVGNLGGTDTYTATDYINVFDNNPVLVISEIMQNPSAVNDSDGEWFEVYNPTNASIDMNGWTIKDDDLDSHLISSSVIVPAKGFATLGVNSNSSLNGNYVCDFQYSNFYIANGADEIVLIAPDGVTEIDRVVYDGGPNWPDPTGSSMVFTGTASDDNNDFSFWVTSSLREQTYSGTSGDKGSPGTNGQDQNLVPLSFGLDIMVFLEGPFNGTGMNTNVNAIMGLTQPYSVSPWNYPGTESVVSLPNANIVDWVLVELRDAANAASATGSTVIGKQAAFVLNDGSVVGVDGSSSLQFDLTVSNQLFVVVYHRNHLGVMSANALVLSGGGYTYDFTVNVNQAYLSGQNLVNGKAVMIAGDSDGNGTIDSTDKTAEWETQSGMRVYSGSDSNMDTEVDNRDKNDFWLPNYNSGSQVPQ